ncbi:MAG: hypothetical protein A2Y66_06075 [Nitrospirae bacterium RBG_13_41_22]|nr:MAG: hypothetical protein A2Y66_06075 [Nitrospirae bacterium RBG_13_41_22]
MMYDIVDMHNTFKRFQEAQFFFDKLRENKEKQPDFDYYLNAFISSARTTFWIMKAEFGDIKKWQEWYDLKKFEPEQEAFIEKITDLRNRAVKKAPLETKMKVKINKMPESLDEFMKLGFDWLIEKKKDVKLSYEAEQQSGSPYKIKGIYFEHDIFPGEDILKICENYLKMLQEKVFECIDLFGLECSIFNYLKNNPERCKELTGEENILKLCPERYKLIIKELADRWTRNMPEWLKQTLKISE